MAERKTFHRIKTIFIIVVPVLILVIIYLLFFGRLHFLSPFIIGFDKEETQKTRLYFHEKDIDVSCLYHIDSVVELVENFHELTFKQKVDFIISSDKDEHYLLNWHSAPFIAHPFNGRIYVQYSEEYFQFKPEILYTYLHHELSHSIIFQNISNFEILGYPCWFLEGIATYDSDMVGVEGYLSKYAVEQKMRDGYFIHPYDWGTFGMPALGETAVTYPFNDLHWFAYSEFACIIDDLIENYDEQQLIELLHSTIEQGHFYETFEKLYDISFDQYISEFKERILSDR